MAPGGRGGRGGGRGGAYGGARGTVSIGGVELNWDLSGLEIQKGPAERFPDAPPPQAPPPTEDESATVQHYLAVRDRIHEGPFYTILNDGMKNGMKRKANQPVPTEASLFNPFADNLTYTSKYSKVRRRIPKLDARPYVTDLFPSELRSILEVADATTQGPTKKRKLLAVSKVTAVTRIEQYLKQEGERARDGPDGEEADDDADEDDEAEEEDEKPDAVDEDEDFSAASSDSEESGDDYNAEQYFDGGDDDDIDDGDPYENTYE